MLDGPNIARIASLMGDPARANMLCALMDGRALTATELAAEGGITKQTASAHLTRLEEAGLLTRAVQGRHRYFRLANEDVAGALEALMGVAQRQGGKRVRTGPKEPELRRARICYDHLAGEVAVAMFDRLKADMLVAELEDESLVLTQRGHDILVSRGLDIPSLQKSRRRVCRACLDWSARRSHLAGALGAALFDLAAERKLLRRDPSTRLVTITPKNEAALIALCSA